MNILNYKKEAFDGSMPSEIRTLLTQPNFTRFSRGNNLASNITKFDPATTEFADVSNAAVSTLRNYIKANDYVLFIVISGKAFMVTYDATNKGTGLNIEGAGSDRYKDWSLTKLVQNADSIYAAKVSNDIIDKRNDRYASRKGLVSRPGQAQDSTFRSDFDGQEWKKDASGYWYDANRLARKLTDLNADDSAAYVSNGADVFRKMVSMYTDHIKELASDDDIFNIDNALRNFTYEGQRILSLASDKIRDLKYLAEIAAKTLEDINSQRSVDNKEPLSQDEYDEHISDVNADLKQNWLKLRSLERQMIDTINN